MVAETFSEPAGSVTPVFDHRHKFRGLTMGNFTLDVGLAAKLKNAFNRSGWAVEEIDKLSEGDNLHKVRIAMFGEKAPPVDAEANLKKVRLDAKGSREILAEFRGAEYAGPPGTTRGQALASFVRTCKTRLTQKLVTAGFDEITATGLIETIANEVGLRTEPWE